MATFLAFRLPKRLHHAVQTSETGGSRPTSFQLLFHRLANSSRTDEKID